MTQDARQLLNEQTYGSERLDVGRHVRHTNTKERATIQAVKGPYPDGTYEYEVAPLDADKVRKWWSSRFTQAVASSE